MPRLDPLERAERLAGRVIGPCNGGGLLPSVTVGASVTE